MMLVNSKQYSFSCLHELPVYSNIIEPERIPASLDSSCFERVFHNKIINLQERRALLSTKLAQSPKKALTPEQKKELIDEYADIQNNNKLLSFVLESIQKSRQSIAANLR